MLLRIRFLLCKFPSLWKVSRGSKQCYNISPHGGISLLLPANCASANRNNVLIRLACFLGAHSIEKFRLEFQLEKQLEFETPHNNKKF